MNTTNSATDGTHRTRIRRSGDVVITRELLLDLLLIYPAIGVMVWKKRSRQYFKTDAAMNRWNARYAGQHAGGLVGRGYIELGLFNKKFKAHQIIWFVVNGYWAKMLDHIDHDRTNNKIGNLRECTVAENNRNMSVSSRNTSGHVGVSWSEARQKWRARIRVDSKDKHLGYFENIQDAVNARVAANKKHNFHPNHGIQQ